MNIKRLLSAKKLVVKRLNVNVDASYVKEFREYYNLTQIALANILGVTKKTIEKWEQGKNKIKGSSAVLLTLMREDKSILDKVYHVEVVNEFINNDEFVEKISDAFKFRYTYLGNVPNSFDPKKTEVCYS